MLAGGCGGTSNASGPASNDPVVRQAQAAVERAPSLAEYRRPESGPPAQARAPVILVAADLTNGGIAAVAHGVQEAAGAIGWPLRVLNGQATAEGQSAALHEALRLRPGGIILGGVSASEQQPALREARALGVPVVAWQATATPGPQPTLGLFTNVTSYPAVVGRLAADWAIAESGGRAGVVIMTDSESPVDVATSAVMASEIGRCAGCSVLQVSREPLATAATSSAATTTAFLEQFGPRLGYLLATSNAFIEGAKDALIGAGRRGDQRPFSIVAGEGIEAEFTRIRGEEYQKATVAEPLIMEGWQLIDELNRARARQPASHYVPPPRLITQSNVPSGAVFDPPSGYREDYERIWHR